MKNNVENVFFSSENINNCALWQFQQVQTNQECGFWEWRKQKMFSKDA
jgi:hypothetical protein